MRETLLLLVAAHLAGDFLLQSAWIVQRKRSPLVLLLHVAIIAALSALFLGGIPLLALTILVVSHAALDALKTHLLPDGIRTFLLDQAAHAAVLVALSFAFPEAAARGIWLTSLPPEGQRLYLTALTLFAGVLLCVPAGGVMIGIATGPLLREIREGRKRERPDAPAQQNRTAEGSLAESDDGIEGLQRGGRYIGWLERALIMLLLFMNQGSSIGFLFAAKSILRFGEIRNSHHRRIAEYIIIGTLLSFGWGLLASYITQQVLALW